MAKRGFLIIGLNVLHTAVHAVTSDARPQNFGNILNICYVVIHIIQSSKSALPQPESVLFRTWRSIFNHLGGRLESTISSSNAVTYAQADIVHHILSAVQALDNGKSFDKPQNARILWCDASNFPPEPARSLFSEPFVPALIHLY